MLQLTKDDDFDKRVDCWKDIPFHETKAIHKVATHISYMWTVGSDICEIEIDTGVDLIKQIKHEISIYMTALKDEFKADQHAKDNNQQRQGKMTDVKSTLANGLIHCIDSFVDWAATSPVSMEIQSVAQCALRNSKKVYYFLPESEHSRKMNYSPEMNRFVGDGNEEFRSYYMFDVGIGANPIEIAYSWSEYQSQLQMNQYWIMDQTMSMRFFLPKLAQWSQGWIEIWDDIKQGLTTMDPENTHHQWLKSMREKMSDNSK